MRPGLRKLLQRTNLLVGGAITLTVVLMAVLAPWLAPYHPVDDANLLYADEPPSGKFCAGRTLKEGTSCPGSFTGRGFRCRSV